MKRFAGLIALAFAFGGAMAQANTIEVSYSEDFAEMLEDEYGVREGERLSKDIVEDIEQAFAKHGVEAVRVTVVIEDAKPNRPTFEQLSARPGLDAIRSVSLGGMDLSGTAFDADGEVLAEVQYDWFENDIRNARTASTWWDARRASDRFARRLAEAVTEQ